MFLILEQTAGDACLLAGFLNLVNAAPSILQGAHSIGKPPGRLASTTTSQVFARAIVCVPSVSREKHKGIKKPHL
jgi:hypothetical protein